MLPEQEYGIRLHFQGCHVIFDQSNRSYIGPLKMNISLKHQKYVKKSKNCTNFVVGF